MENLVYYHLMREYKKIIRDIMKIKRSTDDLFDRLKEQWDFLKESCKAYDNGFENEAKRIALSSRILLHDTKQSESLLKQLAIKDTIKFIDTAHYYNENNLMPSSCLTYMRAASNGKDDSAKVIPLLGEYRCFHTQPNYKNFSVWWNSVVIDDRTRKFSRKDLILSSANTDGGSHVDPKLPKDYYNLTRNNSMGWILCIGGIKKPIKDFCLASIRQIGFEIDLTLNMLNIDLWRYE